MKAMSELIESIEKGEQSADVLAARIPEMVRQSHQHLPDILAYVITKQLWTRWGYPGYVQYFTAIGVSRSLQQQAQSLVLEGIAADNGGAERIGPIACALIAVLAASKPGALYPREFMCRMNAIEAAAVQHHGLLT
jgi:hypothetical protein